MNILVYNIAASETGALTVLNDFHQQILKDKNNNINWFFVVSTPELKETKNIKVLRYPWIKKSRFHRLLFDYFFAGKILKKNKIDKVLSLQNIIIPNTKLPQVVYIHQAIPFVEYRFKLRENWQGWIYQNLIGSKIIKSIKKSNKVIVQTKWMKEACIKQTGVNKEKIDIVKFNPQIVLDKKYINTPENCKSFFYPATGSQGYKNHITILKACEILNEKGYVDYSVTFTFKGNENKNAHILYSYAKSKNLNINFVGPLLQEEVFDYYANSVLLFPSLIETVGLPLLEAQKAGTFILAADYPYAKEVLKQYSNAFYFIPSSPKDLAELMRKSIDKEFILHEKKLIEENVDDKKIIDLLL